MMADTGAASDCSPLLAAELAGWRRAEWSLANVGDPLSRATDSIGLPPRVDLQETSGSPATS